MRQPLFVLCWSSIQLTRVRTLSGPLAGSCENQWAGDIQHKSFERASERIYPGMFTRIPKFGFGLTVDGLISLHQNWKRRGFTNNSLSHDFSAPFLFFRRSSFSFRDYVRQNSGHQPLVRRDSTLSLHAGASGQVARRERNAENQRIWKNSSNTVAPWLYIWRDNGKLTCVVPRGI